MYGFAPSRRYLLATAIWGGIFLILLAIAVAGLRRLPDDAADGWRIALALLPALPALAGFAVEVRSLSQLDELQQRVALIAVVAGTYAAMALCITAWILERLAGLPRISPIAIFLTFSACSLIAGLIAGRRYR